MAGNYVDPGATRPADLGPCRCPVEPKPHERDSANVVPLFGYGDRGAIRQAGRLGGPEAFKATMLLRGVKSWTLVLPNGSARPVDAAQIALLDEATVDALVEALDEAFAEDPLPNAPGAPSPDGRSGSATSTQETEAPPSSTST